MLECKQIYIDTRFKTADSRSDSDFTIEQPKTINIPEYTIAYINDIVLPVSWTTIDERNNNLYYSISHYVNGGYETSCWVAPTDFKNYNGSTLVTELMLNNKWIICRYEKQNLNLMLIIIMLKLIKH